MCAEQFYVEMLPGQQMLAEISAVRILRSEDGFDVAITFRLAYGQREKTFREFCKTKNDVRGYLQDIRATYLAPEVPF